MAGLQVPDVPLFPALQTASELTKDSTSQNPLTMLVIWCPKTKSKFPTFKAVSIWSLTHEAIHRLGESHPVAP